jgi:ketosteroid isomerase-like protein
MKKALVLLTTVAVLATAAFAQNAKNDEVIAVAKKMALAQESYDPATLDQIYASDYIEISPKGEVDERAKAIGFYKVDDADKARSRSPRYILSDFNVRHYGKFAMVIATFSFGSKTDATKPPMVAGRVVYALRKEKGVWKIYSAQFTPIPRPQPGK